jgi:glyoxylase-like metal-dependent hydrolase (beta-lactamase superfamily II)
MDKVEVRPEDVVSLENFVTGVFGLRILIVNVFAIATTHGQWVLIDAGLNGSAGRITRWSEAHFGTPPVAIVLTHAHFDHVGALEELVAQWKVPVYAHAEEMPYLTGGRSYPAPDPSVGGGLMARMSMLYPRAPLDLSGRVSALPAGGSIPGVRDWRWIHTPGHTPGHVSLFRDLDRTLIVGDASCTTKQESLLAVATQRPELHGPPAYYTPDWDAARASVQRLAALQPACLAPGHGRPLAGMDAPRALQALASRFDEVARPRAGRYVESTERA